MVLSKRKVMQEATPPLPSRPSTTTAAPSPCHHPEQTQQRGITLEARVARIQASLPHVLWKHLQHDVPICLPPRMRWAVAVETIHCLTQCTACARLSQTVSLCQGRNGLKVMQDARHAALHSTSAAVVVMDELLWSDDADTAAWMAVRNIVHAVVNHQARLEASWYGQCVETLLNNDATAQQYHTTIIPTHFSPQRRQRLAVTCMAEILAVISATHMWHMALLLLPQQQSQQLLVVEEHEPALEQQQQQQSTMLNIPPLESVDHLAPTYMDIGTAGMLKRNRQQTFRSNSKLAHAPFCLAKDYATTSPAFQALDQDLQDFMLRVMVPYFPLLGLGIAPQSLWVVSRMAEYISLPDQVVLEPWKELDDNMFCTQDGFTRLDCEVILYATAKSYNTQYCQHIHWAMWRGLQSSSLSFKQRDNHHHHHRQASSPSRHALLIQLCQDVAHKPHDGSRVHATMEAVRCQHGMATAVEAAAHVAMIEAYTKITDSTGKAPIPKFLRLVLPRLIRVAKFLTKNNNKRVKTRKHHGRRRQGTMETATFDAPLEETR